MEEEVQKHLQRVREEHQERVFFIEQELGAEIHWFFTQAVEALNNELYLPACTSFLNGIEASVRITMSQVANPVQVKELDPVKTLSNRLLKSAYDAGLPIEALAFPGEISFLKKIESKKPDRINVEVVRIRHNLCHGNILEYVNSEFGDENRFFTPECCRELSRQLHGVSKEWGEQLSAFRKRLFDA